MTVRSGRGGSFKAVGWKNKTHVREQVDGLDRKVWHLLPTQES